MMAKALWPTDETMRQLAARCRTIPDIAEGVWEANGKRWRPERQAVTRRLKSLSITRGYGSRTGLVPRNLAPEHRDSRWRMVLSAEDKRRKGEPLSERDRERVAVLAKVNALGLVLVYRRDIGFYLVDRTPGDDDVVRRNN
jgi:hypothetical protein